MYKYCNKSMLLECTTILAHGVVIMRGLTVQPCVPIFVFYCLNVTIDVLDLVLMCELFYLDGKARCED